MVHRIVIYVDDLLGGGAARVVSYLSRAWVEMGREVVILTNDDGSKQPHYVLHSSVKHRPLGIRVPSKNPLHAVFLNIWRVHLLRSSIKSCKPDLVVSFLDGNNILCLLATRGIANFPVIISERTDPRGRNIGFYWSNLRRVLYPFADALVAQSSSALSFFSERVRRRGRVIPNPVIVPGAVRTQPRNRSESRFTIISLGSLRPVKGHDLLIRAFHEISARFDNWDLVIFGEGPSRPELSSLIADLGLSARVSLPGSTSDPTCKLLDSDIFVCHHSLKVFPTH